MQDIDLEENFITVLAEISKTKIRRIVPIKPNLKSFLLPLAKKKGKVVTVSKISKMLRATASATDDEKLDWKRNALRHTYIAQLLWSEPEAVKDGIKNISLNAIKDWAERNIRELRLEALTAKVLRNSAPEVPSDNPPAATDYPSREELKPTPLPVPDPAKTESATPTKISIPAYPELKRFAVAMGETARTVSEMFELASAENWQKNKLRGAAFSWLDEAKSSLYEV